MLSFNGDLKMIKCYMLEKIIRKSGHKWLGKFSGKFGGRRLMHRVQKVYASGLFTLFICISKFRTGLIYGK